MKREKILEFRRVYKQYLAIAHGFGHRMKRKSTKGGGHWAWRCERCEETFILYESNNGAVAAAGATILSCKCTEAKEWAKELERR